MKCLSGKMHLVAVLCLLKFGCMCIQCALMEDKVKDGETIPLPNVKECSQGDVLCQDDAVSLDAIRALHKQIDDDDSGNIDVSESQEFFRDELQNTDGFERQTIFHGKDDKISVDDLWHAWKKSTVYNWTVEDVVDWVVGAVELPQYAKLFTDLHFNGTLLPRLAVNNNHFISRYMGIKNTVHKHKLALKAMDVVLFGPPKKPHHFMKDVALVTSLMVALLGCWFAYKQNKASKEQLKNMMKDLDTLQKAEDSLSELTNKLAKAEEVQTQAISEKKEIEQKYRTEIDSAKQEAERLKTERQSSDLEELSRLQLAEEELVQVRAALRQAEKELENRYYWVAPTELQQWLQYTFELEHQHFTAKQQAAQRQFGSAKDACEKMRRKRTGMLGTFRVAQGNSIDDIDQRILQARMALEEIRHDLQERQGRWQTIEGYCGFPIKTNPGLAKLEAVLYAEGGGSMTSSSSTARLPTSLVAPLNVEDADEDFPPQYSAATAMLFSKPNGCTRSLSSYSDMSLLAPRTYNSLPRSHSWRNIPRGLGPTLSEMKRRPVNMGSTNSLPRCTSQANTSASVKRDSTDSSLNSTHSLPVSFHLGGNSPVSSPESPISEQSLSSEITPVNSESKFPRSKSIGGVTTLQNGSRLPKLTAAVTGGESNYSQQRTLGQQDSFLHKRVLTKQTNVYNNVTGSVGSSIGTQDDDSLSGTESTDSDGKKKEKKKLKLIPKFMRKTEA